MPYVSNSKYIVYNLFACIFKFIAYIAFWKLSLNQIIQNKIKLLAVQAPQVILLICKLDGVQFATHLFGLEAAINDFS